MSNTDQTLYDLIIIGAGPAGLGASIYASRYKMHHLVIGAEIGGQVVEAWEIENYAGIEKISGKDLMDKFKAQTEKLGATIVSANVKKVKKNDEGFDVIADGEKVYKAKTIIFALGMKPRQMNVPGEDKFIGKGVSYCATCDAMFFRGKDVVVIGGGDSAATAAIYLSDFANSVKLMYKEESGLKCEPAWIEQIKNNPKIETICCSSIKEIMGDQKVTGIIYDFHNEEKILEVQGVFIEVGTVPGVVVAEELGVKVDEQNYIIVDQTQATNVENVYAAGDVTTGSNKFRQIITAVAEGAVAAGSVYRKLKLKKG